MALQFTDRAALAKVTKYPGLRLLTTRNGNIEIGGTLSFTAAMPGLAAIQNDYRIQLSVPEAFPKAIPTVWETSGRIPHDFHKLTGGGLCLGSPTRLTQAAPVTHGVRRELRHPVPLWALQL